MTIAARRSRSSLYWIVISLLFMFSGCATEETRAPVPRWVLEGRESTEDYVFFLGTGTSESGSIVAAETRALASAGTQITNWLEDRAESPAVPAVAERLEQFERAVIQQLRQGVQQDISGLRLIDKYIDDAGARITVYVLVRIDRSVLQSERRRLDAPAEQQVAPILVPEERARTAAEEGRVFTAIALHLEAALAAAQAAGENSEERVSANLSRALGLAERLTLQAERNRVETYVSADTRASLVVRVLLQPSGAPVADARVLFTYPDISGATQRVVRSTTVRTGTDGAARFALPPPESVGSATVSVGLAVEELLEGASPLSNVAPGELAAVRAALEAVEATIEYVVLSRAREVPTGIVALDTDIAGNPMATENTARGLVHALEERDFTVRRLPYPAGRLVGTSRSAVVEELDRRFGEQLERVILGSGRIEEFNESDGFVVSVTGSVDVYNLRTGGVIYSTERKQRSRGSSSSGAMSAAFRSLGGKLAEALAANLP